MTAAYRTPKEFDLEVADRLHQRGIKPCACGERCPAYAYAWNRVAAGLRGAELGVPALGGEAVMASQGHHKDGRSRHAAAAGRAGAHKRWASAGRKGG